MLRDEATPRARHLRAKTCSPSTKRKKTLGIYSDFDSDFKHCFWRCQCLVAFIPSCTMHYHSQCSSRHFYLIHPSQYLPPLHSDGEASTRGCWAYILNRIPFQIKFKWPPQLISIGSPDNLIHNSVLSQGLEGHNDGLNGGEMLLNGLFVCT